MLKKIGLAIVVLFVLLTILVSLQVKAFNDLWFKDSMSHFGLDYQSTPIHFQWSVGTYDQYVEPHEAILIPVKIEGFSNPFYWQFDTGAAHSLIYERTVEALKQGGLEIENRVLDGEQYATHLSCHFGGQKWGLKMIKVLKGYGASIDKNDTLQPIKLGTLGADFMKGKITLINFKNQYIQLFEERPDWMASLGHFKSFSHDGRRFMLPVEIEGNELELFYDSGCSAFGLITSANRYKKFTNLGDKEIKYEGNRFGESLTIFHKNSDKRISIGGMQLNLERVSYVDIYSSLQKFMTPFTRIGGWLGNKPFIEHAIIFDTKREEFIVVKNIE